MNKEEITCKIPKDQISISPERDNECLIWISPKAINMANTIDELQQENKQLKELCDKYEEEHNTTFEIWKKDNERIDKAIEYIKENKKEIDKHQAKDTNLRIGTFMWNVDELLEILKGVND